jgi:hypothetical protein
MAVEGIADVKHRAREEAPALDGRFNRSTQRRSPSAGAS